MSASLRGDRIRISGGYFQGLFMQFAEASFKAQNSRGVSRN